MKERNVRIAEKEGKCGNSERHRDKQTPGRKWQKREINREEPGENG